MSAPNLYQNGIGGASGADIVTLSPLYFTGTIWYVSSTVGVDAAAPRGKDRLRPLATIAQAHTNAVAGDMIVCLANHTETLTASLAMSKAAILVIGEGTGTSRPKFTRNANVITFDITAAGVEFRNIYFAASTLASALSRVRVAADSVYLRQCYLESGASDTGPAVELITGSDDMGIENTTFISTATLVTAQPESAIKITNATTTLELDNVVIDGGVTGWSNPFAFNGAAAITRLLATELSLLNDSDITLASATSGHLHIGNQSGTARVVWTP